MCEKLYPTWCLGLCERLYFLPLLWKLIASKRNIFSFFACRIQIVTHQLQFMLTHSCTVMKILTDFVMKAKWAVPIVKNAVLTIQLHSVSLLWFSEQWLPCSILTCVCLNCGLYLYSTFIPKISSLATGVPSCKMSMFLENPIFHLFIFHN